MRKARGEAPATVIDVGVVDYGAGNIQSVINAVRRLGATCEVLRSPFELHRCRRIVLPGVGSFAAAMNRLVKLGWPSALGTAVLEERRPFLGICLGMQLLATVGEEAGGAKGLGWVEGIVARLPETDEPVAIPHMGWNDVKVSPHSTMFHGVPPQSDFYFVHSFVLQPSEASIVTATCTHGTEFTAAIEQGHIWGTQFHPEKSQKSGLMLLANFVACSSTA
jgi:glutamine amidotransferase